MKYYTFEAVPYHEEQIFTRVQSPLCDVDGNPLQGSLFLKVLPNEIRPGIDVKSIETAYLFTRKRRGLFGDILVYPFRNTLIISRRLAGIITDSTLCIQEDLSKIDIKVMDAPHGKLQADFVMLWPRVTHDVVDRSRAQYKCIIGTSIIEHVSRWAIEWALVPPYDLFAADHNTWIASERAIALCEHVAKGLRLGPID